MNPAFARTCLADPSLSSKWFSGGLTATHPPLTRRMDRLAQAYGIASVSGLQAAVDKGKEYADQHKNMTEDTVLTSAPRDDLAAINQGNVMGRVFRVLSDHTVEVLESDNERAVAVAWLKPGDLVVAFDDPGKRRQVNTSSEMFGYIDRKVKLKLVPGVLPQELYNAKSRAAVEEALAQREAADAAAHPAAAAKRDGFPVMLGLGAALLAGVTVIVFVFWK